MKAKLHSTEEIIRILRYAEARGSHHLDGVTRRQIRSRDPKT